MKKKGKPEDILAIFDVVKKEQIGNFVFSQLKDCSVVINTVEGVCVGTYIQGEPVAVTVANCMDNINDPGVKTILRNLATSLFLAHSYAIVDAEALTQLFDVYDRLGKRVTEAMNKAGDELGIKDPDEGKTDEQILDEVEEKENLIETAEKLNK